MKPMPCAVEQCSHLVRAKGLCNMHYLRLARHGSLDRPGPTSEERFWAKVNKTETCWLWVGAISDTGYGAFFLVEGKKGAHRVSYEWATGRPIPEGLVIDHLCRNRACVNPAHLEAVPQFVNLHRGENVSARLSRANQCARGHDLISEGYVRPDGKGRICRACARLRYARKVRRA